VDPAHLRTHGLGVEAAIRPTIDDNRLMTRSAQWELRRATGADAAAVAAMHVRAWQAAYRGIIPDSLLDSLDVGARARRYSFDRPGPGDPETWIAVDGDDVVGMVSVGPGRDEDLPGLGEVWALYVAPDRWRSGAGSALLAKAERLLADAGFTDAFLWVLEDNAPGRSFYEAAGWDAEGGTKTVDIGGRELVEVRYRRALTGNAPDGQE
jgi:ribosomal protein S18 acetylase RimI-like enzyme